MLHYQVRPRGPGTPTISVILVDWMARESFHSLAYLNAQTFPRDRTELIWVEFYDHRPAELRDAMENPASRSTLDKWIVLGRSAETYYHKHELYNAGLIAASGEICVICDSDAIFSETFLYSVYLAFRQSTGLVLHVDEVRSENRRFYPFNHPRVADFLAAPGLINWTGHTTTGLVATHDALHERNYGACLCARRRDLIEIGGADEHHDYLGYICGPHEMTFRLGNAGRREKWLDHEWLYHAWHPGQSGGRSFGGAHDGRNFSLRTLDLLQNRRVTPWLENPAVAALQQDDRHDRSALLEQLVRTDRTEWTRPEDFLESLDPIELVEENVTGHNVIQFGELFVALAQSEGAFTREQLFERKYLSAFVARDCATVKAAIAEGPSSRYHISRVGLPDGVPPPDLPDLSGPLVRPPAVPLGTSAALLVQPPLTEVTATTGAANTIRTRARIRSRLAARYGQALYAAGESRRALAEFDLALSSDSGNHRARRGRANVFIERGRPELALQDFEAALEAIPAHHVSERCEALTGRGWAHYQIGDWRRAIDDFSEALSCADSLSHQLVESAYQGRGWARSRAGLRRDALADFRSWRVSRGLANRGWFWLDYRIYGLRGRLARIRRRWRSLWAGRRGDAMPPVEVPSAP